MSFIDFDLFARSFPMLLSGAYVSVQIAFFSCLLGLALGCILALVAQTHSMIARICVTTYVTIIRGTPMLIQISFWYFALGLHPFIAAILGIGLNSAAYVSEIIRSGIAAVGKGQIEAAQVLGLHQAQIIRYIILPQALRTVLPALGNEFVTLIKDSSLASVIGVAELYRQGSYIRGRTYDVFTTYAAMALIYLILTSSISLVMSYFERKLQRHAKH